MRAFCAVLLIWVSVGYAADSCPGTFVDYYLAFAQWASEDEARTALFLPTNQPFGGALEGGACGLLGASYAIQLALALNGLPYFPARQWIDELNKTACWKHRRRGRGPDLIELRNSAVRSSRNRGLMVNAHLLSPNESYVTALWAQGQSGVVLGTPKPTDLVVSPKPKSISGPWLRTLVPRAVRHWLSYDQSVLKIALGPLFEAKTKQELDEHTLLILQTDAEQNSMTFADPNSPLVPLTSAFSNDGGLLSVRVGDEWTFRIREVITFYVSVTN